MSHSDVPNTGRTPKDWRTGGSWDWRLNVSSFGKNWNRSRSRGRVFVSPTPLDHNPTLSGVSRDSTGAALGDCVTKLFRSWDDEIIATTVSDGSGNYTFYPPSSGPYYVVWYKAGSPDVAGTSLNTLVAI